MILVAKEEREWNETRFWRVKNTKKGKDDVFWGKI